MSEGDYTFLFVHTDWKYLKAENNMKQWRLGLKGAIYY